MAQAAVAVDLHQPLDVDADVLARFTLDLVLVGDDLEALSNVVLAMIFEQVVLVNTRLPADVARARTANTKDIRQAHFDPLVEGELHTRDTCHCFPFAPS